MKSSLVLFLLITVMTTGANMAYARDCTAHIQCNHGEYCKGGGVSVSVCPDCEEECGDDIVCDIPCLIRNWFRDCDPVQAIGVCEEGVIIFENANYEGKSQGLPIGSYKLSSISIGNDTLSSLRVPTGWTVTLYRDHRFEGMSRVFTTSASFVGSVFNDQTSSIVVSDKPSVIIFEEPGYKGFSQSLLAGRYDLSDISIGNDALSSLKVPDGWRVTLYTNYNFSGEEKVFSANTSFVGSQFNDQTSSIVVED